MCVIKLYDVDLNTQDQGISRNVCVIKLYDVDPNPQDHVNLKKWAKTYCILKDAWFIVHVHISIHKNCAHHFQNPNPV